MEAMKVIGVPELDAKLKMLANASLKDDSGTVYVGYTQAYSLYVHEVQARHKPGKTWKYLEIPLRALTPLIPKIVEKIYWYSKSLMKGLLVAGLRIQRESMLIVPIDTRALRASAFTATDKTYPIKVNEASAKAATATARYYQKEARKAAKAAARAAKKGTK